MSHWRIRPALRRHRCPYTRLDRPLQLQEVEASRISRQSAHEGGKVVTPTHRPHLPPGYSPVFRRRTIHNIAWTPEIVSDFVVFFFAAPKRMLRYYFDWTTPAYYHVPSSPPFIFYIRVRHNIPHRQRREINQPPETDRLFLPAFWQHYSKLYCLPVVCFLHEQLILTMSADTKHAGAHWLGVICDPGRSQCVFCCNNEIWVQRSCALKRK